MKLRKCSEHGYTLEEKCKKCGKETKEGHYKFVKIRSVEERVKIASSALPASELFHKLHHNPV
ncbi:hypothetical protein J4462_01240 [Candidatus Pacearchaeota archaeon]|nr:hypothetical protein [Candidatus Pacearchaeota archaeon]